MKALKQTIQLLALAAFFFFPATVDARKKPVDVSDSFFVNPGTSPNIAFHTKMVGGLTQRNDTTWIFHGGEARETAYFGLRMKPLASTAPLKFDDCAYFSPATQACIWDSRVSVFLNSHFFISPAIGGQAGSNVPASVRFYLDTARIETAMHNYLATDTFPQSLAAHYLRPFYFRKYEVTNKEYREFVQWVTDSIARTRLGYFLPNGLLDRKRNYDLYDSATDSIAKLIAPPERRFFSRKEIDSRKIIYRFQNRPEEFPADTLAIYPDTTSWMVDFQFSFNEPMQNLYFWHPAYEDYPVTGVNYWQCMAFLDWKSVMLTKQFAKSKQQYKIVCSLPSEIEWDYVSTAELYKEQLWLAGQHYRGTCDDSWLTDLFLTRASVTPIKIFNEKDMMIDDTIPDQVLSVGRPKKEAYPYSMVDDQFDYPMRRHSLEQEKTWGDFIYDGYFHTGPAKIFPNGFAEEKPKHKVPNERSMAHYDNVTGICWLDGNVSEWLREDLDRNWRGIFLKHCVVPDGPYAAEQKQIVAYEKHYYDQLPAHGKLVRGANWMDERFAMKYGKNVGGTQAKTFCDPNEAHCTVGFRYVIYLEEK